MKTDTLNNLFPGLSFFGNTESTALEVSIDKIAISIRLFIKSETPEILNFRNLNLFGLGNEKLKLAEICSIEISSVFNGDKRFDTDNIFKYVQGGIHTNREYQPSIEIKFFQPTYVKSIRIYNREDKWAKRNQHLAIDLLDTNGWNEIWCNSSLTYAQTNLDELKKWLPSDFNFNEDLYSDTHQIRETIKKIICGIIDFDSKKFADVVDSIPVIVRLLDIFGSTPASDNDLTILAAYFVHCIKNDASYNFNFNFIEPIIPDEVRLCKLEKLIHIYCEKLSLGNYIFTRHGLVKSNLLSNQVNYVNALQNLSNILTAHGRQNCLLYGTLLGAIREQGFIPHDDDVDMCVFSNATVIDEVISDRNEIVSILRKNGLKVVYEPTNFWNIHVVSPEDNVTIDLFPIFVSGEKVFLHMEKMKIRDIPLEIMQPISQIKLYNKDFFAPANPEAFLFERYGEFWNTSDRFFEFPYEIRRKFDSISFEQFKQIKTRHIPSLYVENTPDKWLCFKNISINLVFEEIHNDGDWCQFGVFKGATARLFDSYISGDRKLYLFDSFEGLPEDWVDAYKKGAFALKAGEIPAFHNPRTKLVKGWFNDTLPGFVASHPDPLAFLHIDCDLYSSTRTVLDECNSIIVEGTILLFDEFFMNQNEGFIDDECRALYDWAFKYHRKFEILWRTKWVQCAVRILV